MSKPMKKMLIYVGVLFGLIFGWKILVAGIEKYEIYKKLKSRVVTVSAMTAPESSWQASLSAVGETRTYKGVNVTTELGGLIERIAFQPGQMVKKGQLLVQLDISTDIAQLHALEADAKFAKITYDRNLKQAKIGAVSQETLAQNEADYESSIANVAQEKAVIEKKTIRAPFSGKLGISMVNPGQYLKPGDAVVNLQTLSPIYVDFYLPQQDLPKLKVNSPVSITVDTYENKTFQGKITTINPMVDSDVRNVEVEGTFPNKSGLLLPGMFVNVSLNIGQPKSYITLPQAAISFNPYGNIVFRLTKTKQKVDKQDVWTATQVFVDTGDTRGDQIAVLSGIKAGDMVVTAGQLKLANDSSVIINNQVKPSDTPKAPTTSQGQ
ncbi:MAG: efflux transporter periplasmic adaptor subunit [Legionellales bacterium]|nr:efflux transporter periplasmic adaptor subunit [Legionellales bacterium]